MKKIYLFLLLLILLSPVLATTLKDVVPTLTSSNSVLVAGEKADALDWVGAAKIASTPRTTVQETTTEVTSTEDSHNIQKHLTEPISDGDALGSSYLRILNDGTLAGRNTAKTKQYITLSDVADVQFTTSSDNSDKAMDYLVFDADEPVYTYRMDFTPRANSDETGSDFEGMEISILGRNYRITDIDISGDSLELRLLSGDIKDTLEEGLANTYTIDGSTITVSIDVVTTSKVKMTINGHEMNSMETDKVYAIPGSDMYIGIGEILENEAGEVTGRDLVEFYLGASLIELEDDNIEDSSFYDDGITYNSKTISDTYVKIIGETTSSDVYLSSITVEWRPDSEIKVPMGDSLSNFASEGQIFTGTRNHKAFDVALDSEVSNNKETITLRPSSTSEYKLSFDTFRSGYSITAYELNGMTVQTDIKTTEGAVATEEDIVVFSKDKDTVIAKISDITADAAGSGTLKLNDLGGPSNTYNIINHVATVVWHGNTYTLTEQNVGTQVILTDINGDGAGGGYSSIWTKYGGEIRIGYDRTWVAIDGITFLEHEDGKEESGQRGSTEILLTVLSNVLYANSANFTDFATVRFNSYNDKNYARTLWGTYVVDDMDTQKEVTLTYPENEMNFNIKLSGGETQEVTTSGVVSQAEWNILSDKISDNRNLIIIGGPCANEVTYNLLEPSERCNEGFVENESMIKLIDLKNGYYAIIIAGWEKEDTADAVYAFNNYALTGTNIKLRGKVIIQG